MNRIYTCHLQQFNYELVFTWITEQSLPGLHGEITEQRTHITSSIIWNVLLEQKPSGTGSQRGVGHGPDK